MDHKQNLSDTWVVVANGIRARIFEVDSSSGTLREIEDLVHPEARLRVQLMHQDAPGRVFDSAGQGRHAVEVERSAKQPEKLRFAHELAQRLDDARAQPEFRRLVLMASPEFLGLLRSKLSDPTSECVVASINKDLTRLEPSEIAGHLPHPIPSRPVAGV